MPLGGLSKEKPDMHNETVYCKLCGKKLAWWDMFSNIQYEDEYECDGEFKERVHNMYRDKSGSNVTTFTMDGGKSAKKDIKLPEGAKRIKYQMRPCALRNHTKFCPTCAKKSGYKCTQLKCKGHLRLVRRKDGKSTKYGHGGY